MSHRVPCELCGGCGRRPLTEAQSDTVAAVGSDWSTTEQVAKVHPGEVRLTTLCNRLQALYVAGVLERRPWSGRRYQWRVAPVAQRDAA